MSIIYAGSMQLQEAMWRFGPMLPLAIVGREELAMVIAKDSRLLVKTEGH